jgi:lipopolysaccharide transport system permease protein
MIIPAAAVGAALVDFAIAFVALAGLMVWYGVAPTWHVLLLPVLVALTALLAVGVGMWLSALNVKYRDVRYALPFCIQLWMFLSPIIYPPAIVPEHWRWALALNPLYGLIEGYRTALLGQPLNGPALGTSAAVTLGFLVYAAYDFRRMEQTFADVV